MRKFFLCLLALLAIHGSEVFARSEPMPEFTAEQILSKPDSPAAVKAAIRKAAAKLGWEVRSEQGDTLRLVLEIRGKHELTIDVKAGPQAVDVVYVNSINLNYQDRDGQVLIHPSYGRWVNNLLHTAQGFEGASQ